MKQVAIKVSKALLWLVYAWVAIVLVLLFLRFFLELFGANPTAGFVEWVYRSTERAMAPFRGIFEPVVLSEQSLLDVSVLFAMIVYSFIALGLHAAINWVTGLLDGEQRLEARREALAAQQAATTTTRVLQLSNTAGLAATAVLKSTPYGTSIELTATGLAPYQSYAAWVEGADGMRVSTAAFQTPEGGAVRVALSTPVRLVDGQRFGVTLLPRPGESTSTDVLASPLG